MLKSMKLFSLLSVLLVLTACAPQSGAYSVSAQDANKISHVMYGTVTAIHRVEINSDGSMGKTIATVGGAIAGGIIGNLFGAGAGNTLATLAGVGAGATAGYLLEGQMSKREGYQIEVELDNGKRVSVVQGTDQSFELNQHVKIIDTNGTVRVLPN